MNNPSDLPPDSAETSETLKGERYSLLRFACEDSNGKIKARRKGAKEKVRPPSTCLSHGPAEAEASCWKAVKGLLFGEQDGLLWIYHHM